MIGDKYRNACVVEERAVAFLRSLDFPVLPDERIRVHLELRHFLFQLPDHDCAVLLKKRVLVDLFGRGDGLNRPDAVTLLHELVDGVDKRTEPRILDDVPVDTDAPREPLVRFVDVVPRVDDERDRRTPRERPDFLAELEPVHLGHHRIRHDKVDPLVTELCQSLDAVAGKDRRVVILRKDVLEKLEVLLDVIDEKYVQPPCGDLSVVRIGQTRARIGSL